MSGKTTNRLAVAYARYSSNLQEERSVDDQLALCRDFAARNGFEIIRTYDDKAKSGASLVERDGLLRLINDARTGEFSIVVVEALDRISRDQEDMAAIYKRLRFLGIEIIAVHDGKADTIQIGIRSLIGAVYLEDLKHKVRRGMKGRVKDGLSAGGKAYGYKPVLGRPGELAIDEAEAAVVRRIFAEFVAGKSPREIAWGLNQDRIDPPRGAVWTASTINGSRTRKSGILRNAIYGGTLVWNRVRMVLDPDTGKRVSRQNPESEWQATDAPHLRIVEEEAFSRAALRLGDRSRPTGYKPRRPRMLSGLLRCGCCTGGMTLDGLTHGHPRVRCARARDAGTCDHNRKYPVRVIERAVVDGLREQLRDQRALNLYIETYVAERRRIAIDAANNRGRIEADLTKKRNELERLIDFAVRGVIDGSQLSARKPGLDADIARLQAELKEAPPIGAVELHPAGLAAYSRDLASLSRCLDDARADPSSGLLTPLRRLVDSVIIHPSPGRAPIEIEIKGKLAELLGDPTAALPPAGRREVAIGMVAEGRLNHISHFPLIITISRFCVALSPGNPIVLAHLATKKGPATPLRAWRGH